MEAAVPGLFRIIAEYTYDWETWVDADGKPRWVNPAVERMTGFTVAECLARDDYPIGLACPEDRPLLARVLADAAAGGSGNDVEFRVCKKDGSPCWVAISWQSVWAEDGARLGYRTSVRDIDERKRIEDELHVMRRRAEAAVIARSELLANVSHELRSPVHCIAGFAELLAESSLDEKQRHYVALISRECVSMSRHVEDLLQLAALEAGGARLEQRAFDLEELVHGVVEGERTIAKARGLALLLEPAFAQRWVMGDPLRIGQVLRNLVDNALKFTDEGEVRICARSVVDGADAHVELAVRDTGAGMDAREVSRLMEPFQQASTASNRRHGGVGLGLAIVQRLVNAMGGTVQVESEVGRGTSISVTLRLALVAAEQSTPPQRALDDHQGERALVVDDSASARELLTTLLERHGYHVVAAASGAAALAAAAEHEFDLVLLDYQMPDADGAETAVALRRVFAVQKRRPALYLLTANVFVRQQLADASWAIDGILEKPVSREALGKLLERRVAEPPALARSPRGTRLIRLIDLNVVEDLRTLRGRDGGLMLPTLLARTTSDLSALFTQLESAAHAGDLRALSRLAHAIAGHTALLGAQAAARRARTLEQLAERGELSAVSGVRNVLALRRSWSHAHEALRALAG